MRTNIYFGENASSTQQDAVRSAIGLVMNHARIEYATEEFIGGFPSDDQGNVHLEEVTLAEFDPNVELHLIAAPIFQPPGFGQKIVRTQGITTPLTMEGYSIIGKGYSLVHMSNHPGRIRRCTAHEVLHGMGFVLEGSRQRAQNDYGHCRAAACLMNSCIDESLFSVEDSGAVVPIMDTNHEVDYSSRNKPVHLCAACADDLSEHGKYQAATIIRRREAFGIPDNFGGILQPMRLASLFRVMMESMAEALTLKPKPGSSK